MTIPTSILLRKSVLPAIAALACQTALHATTTIHNDGFTANNQALPGAPNYGSNVSANGANWTASAGETGATGTPNIQLVWDGEAGGHNPTTSPGLDTYISWNGRGNVIQLDGAGAGGTPNTFISFVPAGTAAVKINSFALDEWSGGGTMTVQWSILDATKTGTVLANGTWTRTTGGRDTISPTYTGTAGQTLVLQLTRTSGDGTYLALDNLVFDEIDTSIPTIVSFAADLQVIDGTPFNLNWEIANVASATTLTLSDGTTNTNVLPNTDTITGLGSFEVNPTVNTTYTLTLNNDLTKQVSVLSGRAVSLTSSSPIAAAPAYQVTLSWQVQGPVGASVTIADGITVHDVTADTVGGAGSKAFTVPSASTTFTLEANTSGVTRTAQVLREQPSSANLSVNAPSIAVGAPVTVSWANAAGGPTDWIGIYPVSEIPDGNPGSIQWNYLNGIGAAGGNQPSGSMNFTGLPAGDYHVWLLLNDGYTIAQGPVRFSVVNPTIIRVLAVQRSGNQFTLEWESQAGRVYDIYASADLQGDPLVDWTKVADDHPAEGDGSTSFTEDLGATAPPRRFYKVYEYLAP